MNGITERFERDIDMARVYLNEGSLRMVAARLRDLAQAITDHAVEVETRRDYPEEFTRHAEPILKDAAKEMRASVVEHDPIEQHLTERNRRDTLNRVGAGLPLPMGASVTYTPDKDRKRAGIDDLMTSTEHTGTFPRHWRKPKT